MKLETKVGIFTFIAILILAVGIIWKSNISMLTTGYMVVGSFQRVNGLLDGAEVRYRGYLVGSVSKVKPRPRDILVFMHIRKNVKITEGSVLRVDFDGLIGEKYITILPNPEATSFLKSGAVLEGYAASGLVDFIDMGTKNLSETKQILEVFRKIVTNKDSQDSLKSLIININSISSRLDSVLAKVDELLNVDTVRNMGTSVDTIFDSVELILNNLNGLIVSMSGLVEDDDISETLKNLNQFSKKLNELTGSVDKDKETLLKDVQPIVQGAKDIIAQTSSLTKTLQQSTSFMNSTTLNAGAAVFNNSTYELGGSVDVSNSQLAVGIGNDKTSATDTVKIKKLTFGKRWFNSILTSVGLVNFKPGVKLDLDVTDRFSIENSLFNPNNLTYLIQGNYIIFPNVEGLMGYQIDKNSNSEFKVGIGINTN